MTSSVCVAGGDSIEEKIDFFRNKLCPNTSSKRDVIKLKIDRNEILQSVSANDVINFNLMTSYSRFKRREIFQLLIGGRNFLSSFEMKKVWITEVSVASGLN